MSPLILAIARWRGRRACRRGRHLFTARVGRIGRCERCGFLR